MQNNHIESLFIALDESAVIIKDALNLTYLDALAEAGENLFQNRVVQRNLNGVTAEKLKSYLHKVNLDDLPSETVRKAFQLAVLKGMKEGTQVHHILTPDAVSLFISFLVNKLVNKKQYTMLDPAVGSANLVSAIINQTENEVTCYGFDVDETLIKLAYTNANLQQNELELFHEDSIKPMFIPQVDLVVSDLPIGYYPNSEVAKGYELDEEKPFVHHLMIEQSINQAKEGAILIFLIPNFMFESDSAKKLHEFIKREAVILGLLQLPLSMFKSEKYGKSIFILQKHGKNVKQPRQALLAELPSFSRKDALADMIWQINKWVKEERD